MNIDMSRCYAIVVAGGSGTRLWPLSRQELPKQLHNFISDKTLIEETIDRISGVLPHERIFVSTTTSYADKIRSMLPLLPPENIIVEPVARGTTAAFAYFTEVIVRRDPEATIFSLASDHAVSEVDLFEQTLQNCFEFIYHHPDKIGLVGIRPTKPATGLGYIKVDETLQTDPIVYSVEKFVEKPALSVAKKYVLSGEYYWNAAYYCFKAKTLLAAYDEADPAINQAVQAYITSGNSVDFEAVPIKSHEIEIINAKRFPVAVIPADFAWSDIGDWSSLHEMLSSLEKAGSREQVNDKHIDVGSQNTMVLSKSDSKLVVTVGLDNIAVVETPDALLVLNKEHTQDIKQAIEAIKEHGLTEYL